MKYIYNCHISVKKRFCLTNFNWQTAVKTYIDLLSKQRLLVE